MANKVTYGTWSGDVEETFTDAASLKSIISNIKSTALRITVEGKCTDAQADLSRTFYNVTKPTGLDVSQFDTSNAVNMSEMFSGVDIINLIIVNTDTGVSKFNTSNVTNMYRMFYNCSKSTNIDVSKFNTSKVTNMSYMFYGCKNANGINVSGFNTANVTNMAHMFDGLSLTNTLDLRNFDVRKVTDVRGMFTGIYLRTLYSNSDWMEQLPDGCLTSDMFNNCTNLTGAVPFDSSKRGEDMANPLTGYFTGTYTPSFKVFYNGNSNQVYQIYYNNTRAKHLYLMIQKYFNIYPYIKQGFIFTYSCASAYFHAEIRV